MSDEKVQIGLTMDAETLEKIGGQALLTEEIRREYLKTDTELTMAEYRGVIHDCCTDITVIIHAKNTISETQRLLYVHEFGANTKAQYDPDFYYHERYAEDVENNRLEAYRRLNEAQDALAKVVSDLMEIRRQAKAGLRGYQELAQKLGIEKETEEGEEE